MTWVVGVASIDRAFLFGDVRLSTEDGEVAGWGLRKTHPVAINVGIGFAGSVDIGMDIVKLLQQRCGVLDPPCQVEPAAVAIRLKKFFDHEYLSRYGAELRRLGCEVVLVGVSPSEIVTYPNDAGTWTVKNSLGWVMRAPRRPSMEVSVERFSFRNYVEGNRFSAVAIGTGSNFPPYLEALQRAGEIDPHTLLKFAESQAGAEATLIVERLTPIVDRIPLAGVSPDMAYLVLQSDGYLQADNEWSMLNTLDHPRSIVEIETTMGGVARRLGEMSQSKIDTYFGEQIMAALDQVIVTIPSDSSEEVVEALAREVHPDEFDLVVDRSGPEGLAAPSGVSQEIILTVVFTTFTTGFVQNFGEAAAAKLREFVSRLARAASKDESTDTSVVIRDAETGMLIVTNLDGPQESWVRMLTLNLDGPSSVEIYWSAEASQWVIHAAPSARPEGNQVRRIRG